MFCIKCHSPHTKVTNSRPHRKRATIWRRRQCVICKTVFTTLETVATDGMLSVIDPQGGKSPFSIPRLLISIAPLLSEQSSAPDDAYWLAVTAYEKALSTEEPDIHTKDLTSITFSVMERFDSTAALKYALDHHLTRLPGSRARRPKNT